MTFATVALISTVLTQGPQTFQTDFLNRIGLQINASGIHLVNGSMLQVYEPGWTKGLFSSNWTDQKIERKMGRISVEFQDPQKLLTARAVFSALRNTLTGRYELVWNGPKPVHAELNIANLWLTPFASGNFDAGKGLRPFPNAPEANATAQSRSLGTTQKLNFESGVGQIAFEFKTQPSSQSWQALDGRNWNQPWAKARDTVWIGGQDIVLLPGKPVTVEFSISINIKARKPAPAKIISATPVAKGFSARPDADRLPLIPEPKSQSLDDQKPLPVTTLNDQFLKTPAGQLVQRHAKSFWGQTLSGSANGAMRKSLDKRMFPAGGYMLTLAADGIGFAASDPEGELNAARTFCLLLFAKNGKLHVPSGQIADFPSLNFRGVHLFVGPQAPQFHSQLWDRVLGLFKFNKVVLQCERTDWASQPGLATSITMPRAGLGKLNDIYKNQQVEVIPLIQSFGHMEWLFANGKNADLMFNQNVPYSIDPRIIRSETVLREIWKEAIAAFQPKIIHFGLDEVDMRGWPDDQDLVTQLWELQLGKLGKLASDFAVEPMLWGDKALAPGEAVDATHGFSSAHAQKRRAAIMPGAYIADWHYKADPNPDPFLSSLQIWKKNGQKPIASTWFRPENIRGFALAARAEKAGYLQTTWAGYESNEANMIREFEQFSAMVLGADYAWGSHQRPLNELPYDPARVFRKLYFGTRRVTQELGTALRLGTGQNTVGVGPLQVASSSPIAFFSALKDDPAPSEVSVKLPQAAGQSVYVFADCQVKVGLGTPVATVAFLDAKSKEVATSTLNYGWHVVSEEDRRPPLFSDRNRQGITATRLTLPPGTAQIRIRIADQAAGLRLHGLGIMNR